MLSELIPSSLIGALWARTLFTFRPRSTPRLTGPVARWTECSLASTTVGAGRRHRGGRPDDRGSRPNAYASTPYAPTGSGGDPTTPAAKLQRNLFLALDLLEEIMMGKALDGNLRDKRLAVEAATATIKAFISAKGAENSLDRAHSADFP